MSSKRESGAPAGRRAERKNLPRLIQLPPRNTTAYFGRDRTPISSAGDAVVQLAWVLMVGEHGCAR